MTFAEAKTKLDSIGQGHVLRFFDSLSEASKKRLLDQLAAIEPKLIDELVKTYVKQKPPVKLPTKIEPVSVLPAKPTAAQAEHYRRAKARGEELLRQGKVGAFLVAGGQGTRLGYDGPKGEFPVTPVRNKPLFQVFAEQLLNHSRTSGRVVPWYIMTSEVNDGPTRAFFEKHNYFGYAKSDIFFFKQGMMPAFAFDGSMLLGEKDSLALSPDGHGGSLRAIDRSGALADMKRRGIEHLSYFQVDNPLVHTIDPLFIGLHDLSGSEMSSKTIPKAGPFEKVGNFCVGDGKLQVIEYSDLPKELAEKTNASGGLLFDAGSIAIHALRVSFIERLNAGGKLNLPWHRAEKKVPFVDANGNAVKPDSPNAVKLEQFVFDAIPMANNPIVFATERSEEFSPVKNAEGDDSPATCRRDQVRRFASWLESAGVRVPRKPDGEPDCVIEISPLFAVSREQLAAKKPALSIQPGQTVVLE